MEDGDLRRGVQFGAAVRSDIIKPYITDSQQAAERGPVETCLVAWTKGGVYRSTVVDAHACLMLVVNVMPPRWRRCATAAAVESHS